MRLETRIPSAAPRATALHLFFCQPGDEEWFEGIQRIVWLKDLKVPASPFPQVGFKSL